MSAIVNAISAFASWLLKMFVAVFVAIWSLVEDVAIDILDLFLQGLTAVIGTLPVPGFLTGVTLQSLFGQLGGDVLFFFGVFNIGSGIALLGAGFAFRLLRKVVTLFQW
ncbi:DUF2523 domain-containing protein (plasmid) [Ralstonia pseudosolanacearum]|uniref:DUF2523 domain-containing protein n=1 Tax=Ralstonia solanacearum TaxID=305 RepID=A0AA92K4K3_RALSL|nr:DUF2523 domain-containing protein [Ralstonia pseudosolanacearum]QOK98456.1 DUF2523 domain-containing protein [Ralstonia pseudosolanacearum]